jgi:hypothetical protein
MFINRGRKSFDRASRKIFQMFFKTSGTVDEIHPRSVISGPTGRTASACLIIQE